ncbi:type IV toxin-antitoxin system AbiEi family antitoxin [Zafaria sp. Z1313]|uniref:type IV toxin-antitoxin system AbiEi family antitoxin n=1 Tax=unclassified Zafaria TaxID=2828765 RepID=UPI002E75D70C|nr:type IV toxin-antitoxin system AbiEi family antitoxin [Zafaria sp. J156]MEE1621107.1 type IV toxin-antitoxin system AbiEi family antitoxin [Zafaria sp. J156]
MDSPWNDSALPSVIGLDGRHSRAELGAMVLDGVLRPVLPGALVPAGLPDTPEVRAAAAAHVAGRVPAGTLGRFTAAWIHGCAPPPGELEVLVRRFHRLPRSADTMPLRLHEAETDARDTELLGGVPVTTPVRTAVDIALFGEESAARAVLSRITHRAGLGCPPGHLLGRLESLVRRPGKSRAIELVRSMLREVA